MKGSRQKTHADWNDTNARRQMEKKREEDRRKQRERERARDKKNYRPENTTQKGKRN